MWSKALGEFVELAGERLYEQFRNDRANSDLGRDSRRPFWLFILLALGMTTDYISRTWV